MTTLTLICCKIFEDELLHTFQKDSDIDEIYVISDEGNEYTRFCEKADEAGISYKLLPIDSIPSKSDISGSVRVVLLLPFALHAVPKNLKKSVYEYIEKSEKFSDGIFLFYGLCGNSLIDVESDFQDLSCPVKILRDNERIIVDDCIGSLVGGRKGYQTLLKELKDGTYIMTPKWAAAWREISFACGFSRSLDDIEGLSMILEFSNYKTVLKLDTELEYEPNFDENVEEFAKIFNFNIEYRKANLDLIESNYFKFLKSIS